MKNNFIAHPIQIPSIEFQANDEQDKAPLKLPEWYYPIVLAVSLSMLVICIWIFMRARYNPNTSHNKLSFIQISCMIFYFSILVVIAVLVETFNDDRYFNGFGAIHWILDALLVQS